MKVMLDKKVIHRDIKPQNILLCKGDPTAANVNLLDCTVKLTDFGAAVIAEKLNSPGYGTNDYMAPEVLKCNSSNGGEFSYDAKCDMFSLGVVMYQCATIKLPFTVRPTTA